MKRVRAFFKTYPQDSLGYKRVEMIQVLEIKKHHKFLWWNWVTWEEIDREIVPPAIWQQAFILGSTDWKSKWHDATDIEWIK